MLNESELQKYQSEIIHLLDDKYVNPKHGNFEEWRQIYISLNDHEPSTVELDLSAIKLVRANDISIAEQKKLKAQLKSLSPWRKGPFDLFGIYIDTEWRSDWKWSRVEQYLNFSNKLVLDIGCGNGYYALRMQGAGAQLVLGIDPSWHYVFQFHTLQKYTSLPQRAFVLPFTFEEFPETKNSFDCIFSMGVLYHRREPQVHLNSIYSFLKKSGQLILETLILKDEDADILIPNERYANMRNVWMIPSIHLLKTWLKDAGFKNMEVIDSTYTTVQEQRQTEWMTRYSLAQALDSNDSARTIEGYQAPLRAIVVAGK